LALFNLGIDRKLRGCDVVSLKVEDVAPHGYAINRATIRQKKTGRPVKFEITKQTRQAIDDYLHTTSKTPSDFLFTGYRGKEHCLTTRQYARLVSEWVALAGLDPPLFLLSHIVAKFPLGTPLLNLPVPLWGGFFLLKYSMWPKADLECPLFHLRADVKWRRLELPGVANRRHLSFQRQINSRS
jgi:hypothetical protein